MTFFSGWCDSLGCEHVWSEVRVLCTWAPITSRPVNTCGGLAGCRDSMFVSPYILMLIYQCSGKWPSEEGTFRYGNVDGVPTVGSEERDQHMFPHTLAHSQKTHVYTPGCRH